MIGGTNITSTKNSAGNKVKATAAATTTATTSVCDINGSSLVVVTMMMIPPKLEILHDNNDITVVNS